MVTFTTFNNRLPDPTFGVNDAGAVDAAGAKGPGFASVKFTSNESSEVSRTISNRGIHRSNGSQHWSISIRYNPMLRDDFDVVSSFLETRRGRLNTFFIVLPQYSKPKNSLFAAFALANTITVLGAHAAGVSTLNMNAVSNFVGTPKPNDFFTITDPNDVTHLKAYKITRVETNALYQDNKTQPALNQLRVHTNPPLEKPVAAASVINFINPMFRVMQRGDVIESDLNTNNLFEFGLEVEEIQP